MLVYEIDLCLSWTVCACFMVNLLLFIYTWKVQRLCTWWMYGCTTEEPWVSEKVNVKVSFYAGFMVQKGWHTVSEQMSYHVHQNIQWLMFNICFLLFLFQMFYICPWRHLTLKCYFYCFYFGTMCKTPVYLLERQQYDVVVTLYFKDIEDLKSSRTARSMNCGRSVLQTGIFENIFCVFLSFSHPQLAFQDLGFLLPFFLFFFFFGWTRLQNMWSVIQFLLL